jgi:tetratricopeptide (TPR) repeat protein
VYGGGETHGVRIVRLFRKLPGVRYQSRLHEQITPSLGAAAAAEGLVLSSCEVVLEHLGYQDHVMASRRKDERNERLFRLDLAERPDDIYVLYKFGDFLRRLRSRGTDCLELLERALEIVYDLPPHERTAVPYAGEIAALVALEHAREERLDHAHAVVERALCCLMTTPNLHYIAAGLELRVGREDVAIAHFRQCLAYRDQVLVVPIQEGVTGHVSLTGLAQAWLQKGDRDRALRLLEQSRALCPEFDVTALALSRLHFERGQLAESVRVLTDHLAKHPDSAGACQQASLILTRLGMTDQARAMGQRAVHLLEKASLKNEASRMRETVATLG